MRLPATSANIAAGLCGCSWLRAASGSSASGCRAGCGAGIDFETFTGPFVAFWGFGQYLLPLAVLELYFRALDRANPLGLITMAAGLLVLTVGTGIGIFAASAGMWLPRL